MRSCDGFEHGPDGQRRYAVVDRRECGLGPVLCRKWPLAGQYQSQDEGGELRFGRSGLGRRRQRQSLRAHVLAGAVVQHLAVGGPAGPLWVYAGSITWTDSAGKTGTIPAPSVEFISFAATDPAKGGYALWGTTADYSPK